MRAYVRQAERRALEAEATRQSRLLTQAASDPQSDEARIMREIEGLTDTEGWTG